MAAVAAVWLINHGYMTGTDGLHFKAKDAQILP
jgi:hypothetical protein